MEHPRPLPPSPFRIAAWTLALLALFMVLRLHLLSATLAGLLVFELVHVLAPLLQRRLTGERARLIAVALLSAAIVGLLTLAIFAVVAFFRSETGGLQALFERMAQILDQVRAELPASVVGYLPEDPDTLRRAVVEWLRTHGAAVQLAGKEAVQTFVHVLAGMVLGALVALHEVRPAHRQRPLARELLARSAHFADAFRRIVFAQIKISFFNTAFTALFLLAILPLAGVHLPLAKTMIAVTFVVGLLPVIGNLISNTVITVIALSVSPYVALAALAFLVVIHKLEYFLNARIVGNEIHARAWELLLAMLVMEAAFGLPGVAAAPIYYAYVKRELADQGWV